MYFTLPANPPFSLPAVISSHGWIRLAPFLGESDHSALSYVTRLSSGRVVDLRLGQADGGVGISVDASLDAKEQQEIERVVIWMLGLDQDFSAFYIHARGEPKLQAMVAGRRGRVLRCPSLFEDIIKTILTTNTLWGGTIRMTANLVAFYGDPLPADPTRRAFPSPERLATLDEESLRESVRVGYRAPYILELARGVASGVVDLEAFKSSTLPTIELRKELMRIKGVGGYAAANLLMILGRYDFIPVDSWALKMVSHEWHAGESITPADVESAFAHWGEWKGLAFWFWDWAYQG